MKKNDKRLHSHLKADSKHFHPSLLSTRLCLSSSLSVSIDLWLHVEVCVPHLYVYCVAWALHLCYALNGVTARFRNYFLWLCVVSHVLPALYAINNPV